MSQDGKVDTGSEWSSISDEVNLPGDALLNNEENDPEKYVLPMHSLPLDCRSVLNYPEATKLKLEQSVLSVTDFGYPGKE